MLDANLLSVFFVHASSRSKRPRATMHSGVSLGCDLPHSRVGEKTAATDLQIDLIRRSILSTLLLSRSQSEVRVANHRRGLDHARLGSR
jgi:hypothetical protein